MFSRLSTLSRMFMPNCALWVKLLIPGLSLLLLPSCGKRRAAPLPRPPATYPYSLIDESALNRKVDPCQDFYTFACGNWISRFQLPPGYSRWTRSFNSIDDENLKTLRGLLQGYSAGKRSPRVASAHKLGDYYAACMDERSATRATRSVLPQEIQTIEAIRTPADLPSALAILHAKGVDAFFSFDGEQDFADATKMIGVVDRGGMGLPDRDYYLSLDPGMVRIRHQYAQHISRTLELSGVAAADAEKQAATVLRIETDLAKHSLSLAGRRDPARIYHPMSLSDLKALAPGFEWDRYFIWAGVAALSRINVSEPRFFQALDGLLMGLSMDDVHTYLRWEFLRMASAKLDRRYEDEQFAFYGKILAGKKAQSPRWKRCVGATSAALGEALGQAYVQLKFPAASKAETLALVAHLQKAVAANFEKIGWMDSFTRAEALKKLSLIVKKIGYPDKWLDYSALTIDRSSYFQNAERVNVFATRRNLAKIGRPVDRAEWGMSPQTVNAYYNPSLNEIVFPAAILQPPFFDPRASLAANYGGIGMVIGHETTHAFDDEGRHFDGYGNLRDWWTDASAKAFTDRAACLVKQYEGYTVSGGVHLNGRLTLGENIADLGGLKLSYAAFQRARRGHKAIPSVAGFNEDQQFFVAFAQGWCTKMTPAQEKLRARTDPHSDPRYRVNGVVVNLPEFEQVFGCKTGVPMAPQKRCSIW